MQTISMVIRRSLLLLRPKPTASSAHARLARIPHTTAITEATSHFPVAGGVTTLEVPLSLCWLLNSRPVIVLPVPNIVNTEAVSRRLFGEAPDNPLTLGICAQDLESR